MVGLGGTAEKLQKVASMAEDVYKRLNEMRREMNAMRETVERIDKQTTDNRALLEALAEQQGVDVDTILAEAAIQKAEPEDESTVEGGESSASEPTSDGTSNETSTNTSASSSTTADADGGTTDSSSDSSS